jgi:hypothetical protein
MIAARSISLALSLALRRLASVSTRLVHYSQRPSDPLRHSLENRRYAPRIQWPPDGWSSARRMFKPDLEPATMRQNNIDTSKQDIAL